MKKFSLHLDLNLVFFILGVSTIATGIFQLSENLWKTNKVEKMGVKLQMNVVVFSILLQLFQGSVQKKPDKIS